MASFEELDRQTTTMGEVTLRRRFDPALRVDVTEVKLGEEFLMSSLFTVAEVELARLALDVLGGDELEVVVGGLGLGYTAKAVLESERVRSLTVIEALDEVISWHQRGLVPMGRDLASDERCRLVHGDFFAWVESGSARRFSLSGADRVHAVLVDIDHSPRRVLNPAHAGFYTVEGLKAVAAIIQPGGVFGLWSDDEPDPRFIEDLEQVFAAATAEVVTFPNPYTAAESSNTVYLARPSAL